MLKPVLDSSDAALGFFIKKKVVNIILPIAGPMLASEATIMAVF